MYHLILNFLLKNQSVSSAIGDSCVATTSNHQLRKLVSYIATPVRQGSFDGKKVTFLGFWLDLHEQYIHINAGIGLSPSERFVLGHTLTNRTRKSLPQKRPFFGGVGIFKNSIVTYETCRWFLNWKYLRIFVVQNCKGFDERQNTSRRWDPWKTKLSPNSWYFQINFFSVFPQ